MRLNNVRQLERDCLLVSHDLRVISMPVSGGIDPLLLGASLSISPIIYFSKPQQVVEYLAIGSWYMLDTAGAQRMTHDYGDICCFGAHSFFLGNHSDEYWIVPKIWLEKTAGQWMLHVVMDCIQQSSVDAWAMILPILEAMEKGHVTPQEVIAYDSMTHVPNQQEWTRLIDAAKQAMERQLLEKVVLARKTSFVFESSVNPFLLLRRLQKADHHVVNFCLKYTDEQAFIGGTPERLFEMNGRTIASDAIAGSLFKYKGSDSQSLRHDLQNSQKNVGEHQHVVDAIRDAFSWLCQDWQMDDAPSIVELAYLMHLMTHFNGVLKPEYDWRTVLNTLHPTPAVAGVPTNMALSFIQNNEPFDRGFYSGPIGVVSQNHAYIVVAIRSGVVSNQRVDLIAGAGIVGESNASEEWEELNAKIYLFMAIFGGQNT